MKQTKNEKVQASKELAERLKTAQSLFFTEYQGLKFVELYELRGKLRPVGCRYSVAKNALLKHALKGAGIDGASAALLKGPVALVVGQSEDPVGPARVLAAFAKDFPKLRLKAGFVGGQWLGAEDVKKLSSLGSRPELLAKVAGALHSAVAQAAGVLQAPIRDLVLVMSAVKDMRSKEGAPA